MKFQVLITDTCLSMIEGIPDKKIQRTILGKIEGLADNPEGQGKQLVKNLSGFRSIRAAGRYRVVFRVDGQTVTVYILAAGIRKEGDRKDIYEIAKKLLRAGLLGKEVENED